jgi:hypothetical protein
VDVVARTLHGGVCRGGSALVRREYVVSEAREERVRGTMLCRE